MKRYLYVGPVKEFDTVINDKWAGETLAVSEKKAKSNLVYQYKQQYGRSKDSKITLPGKLIMEG